MGWAGGRGKCSSSTKDRCFLHMVEPLEAKHTVSTEGVLSSPVRQAPRGTQHLFLSSGTCLNFPYITSEASSSLVPFVPSLL